MTTRRRTDRRTQQLTKKRDRRGTTEAKRADIDQTIAQLQQSMVTGRGTDH